LALSKTKNALKGQRFADIPDIQGSMTTLLLGIPKKDSGSGTIVTRRAQLHKESISKATAVASAQESTFSFTGSFQKLICRIF
jgi:hypothetical protein